MHASVGRRRGFEQCGEATRFTANDFALINDHTVVLQGQDKSMIYPAAFSTKPRPMQGGDIRNSIGFNDSRNISGSCGKRNRYPQTHKKDITVPMSAEASIFSAGEYTGIVGVSDFSSSQGNTTQAQDELKKKGKDLLYCDWPELDSLLDFDTNLRLDDAKEFLPRIDLVNPMEIQPPSMKGGRETPLNCEAHASSSSGEIERFSQNSDLDLFCPFDDLPSTTGISSYQGLEVIVGSNQEMTVPTTSRIMCNDEIASSSTCSGPDFVAAYASCSKKKTYDPLNGTPDVILDGMAENPLEIYFPALRTYEQPELLMSGNAAQTHQFPEYIPGDVMNSVDLQFCSKKRTSSEPCVNPCSPMSPLILEAVPVKDLGFQKLQESMNQLNVATKMCIRDALYRLATCVEQRHYAAATADGVEQAEQLATTSKAVEPSGSKRLKPSRWTDEQTGPLDRSVAQLLLRKPPHPPRQANHAVT